MSNIDWRYPLAILFSLITLGILAYVLFPDNVGLAFLLGILPLIILGLGFRIITTHRISSLRHQLLQIIGTLEEFDLDEPKKVVFEKSPYQLFNELNERILELIERIRSNFRANRQFTQNASHELQTPLAIIKGHVEILLNAPRLGEKQATSLGVILQNTNRLARLNKALILLSKIENNRYSDFETVHIASIIEDVLDNFRDLLQIQEIQIEKNYHHNLEVEMSKTLAEILFTNLFQNAIRYNVAEGFIKIVLEKNKVTIANSGAVLKVAPETLFKRFKRQSEVEESLGLGLSIVQRICDLYDIKVEYLHQYGLHQLILTFPTQ